MHVQCFIMHVRLDLLNIPCKATCVPQLFSYSQPLFFRVFLFLRDKIVAVTQRLYFSLPKQTLWIEAPAAPEGISASALQGICLSQHRPLRFQQNLGEVPNWSYF